MGLQRSSYRSGQGCLGAGYGTGKEPGIALVFPGTKSMAGGARRSATAAVALRSVAAVDGSDETINAERVCKSEEEARRKSPPVPTNHSTVIHIGLDQTSSPLACSPRT